MSSSFQCLAGAVLPCRSHDVSTDKTLPVQSDSKWALAFSPTLSFVVTDTHKAILWNLLLGATACGQLIQIVVHFPEALGHTLRREPSLRVLIPAFVDGGTHQSHTLQEITCVIVFFFTASINLSFELRLG